MTWLVVRDQPVTIETVARRRHVDFTLMYLAVLGGGLFVAAIAWTRSWQPYIGLSVALLFVTWLAWLVRPLLGLYLTLFFALLGDAVTISWFPFNKNLSSHESILWIADGLTVSPLELTLVVALLVVANRRWAQHRPAFERGVLVAPLGILLATILFGFAYGLGRGGDLRAAIFEVRPLLYFPIVYLLTISVCERARDYRRLLYTALAAIAIQSLLSARYAAGLSPSALDSLESLTEHGSSIGMNLLFVTLIASLAIRGSSWGMRFALLFVSAPAIWVYLLSQRRVAFVAFVLALILFAVVLFWRQRVMFWCIVPIVSILGVGYVGAFWHSNSPVGFPAQAVKTVIAPAGLSPEDQSSDQYRAAENFDLQMTVRSSPVLGLGFGQPFLRPIPLPDISVFEFNEYIPHNSVLWLWIKTGFVGFIAFLYLLARTIVSGVDRVRRQAIGIDLVVSIAGLLFVVMFGVYLFADIAWEPRNSVLLGACMALCTSGLAVERDAGVPTAAEIVGGALAPTNKLRASPTRTAEPVADANGAGSAIPTAMAAENLSELVGAMGAWLEADVAGVPIEDRYRVSTLILRGDVLGIALEDVEATSEFGESDRELLDRVRAWALAEQKRRRVSARIENRKASAAAEKTARKPAVGGVRPIDASIPAIGRAAVASATLAYMAWPEASATQPAAAGDSRTRSRRKTRRPPWFTEEALWWAVALLALAFLIWRRVM